MPLYLKAVLPIAGLVLGIFSLTVLEGARSQTPTNEAPLDAIAQAQTPKEAPMERPEQKKTAHDLSDVFNPSNAVPSSEALTNQTDRGQMNGFDFYRDRLTLSPIITLVDVGILKRFPYGGFRAFPQRKMYKKIPINGQHEVIGMSGDIALYQGKPVVHTHMVVGTSDGTTRAGHVLDAYVSPTLEVMVTVDPVAMQKRFDPETDLTLIDPALK